VSYYDNHLDTITDWLTESVDNGSIRVATGFIDYPGLDAFFESIPENSTVRILTGTARDNSSGSISELLENFESQVDEAEIEGIKSVYNRLLATDRVSIRKLSRLHAKLYLTETGGLVGSSNLTENGLRSPFEFNTSLSSEQHTEAGEWFDERWEDAEQLRPELIKSVERSNKAVQVVNTPISEAKRLNRVVDLSETTAETIADSSLSGQIARLDAKVDFYEADPTEPNASLGEFGIAPDDSTEEYLSRLLIRASERRDAPDSFKRTLNRLRTQIAPYNQKIWRNLQANDESPDLPVEHTGLAWYLEWYLQDSSLQNLPDDPEQLAPESGPVLSLKPWDHQNRAFEEWADAGYRGIMEMATGTGKTVVGLDAIERTYHDRNPQASVEVLVTAHTTTLKNQWKAEINANLGVDTSAAHMESSDGCNIRVVTPQDINENFDQYNARRYDLIIVDEVHHYHNTEGWGQVMTLTADRILGLSAEISGRTRAAITDTLGPVVFEYSQQEAISDGIVPEFEWQLHPIGLTKQEQDEYERLTQVINGLFRDIKSHTVTTELAQKHNIQIDNLGDYFDLQAQIEQEPPEKWKQLDRCIRKRREIVYKSENAIDTAQQIAQKYADKNIKTIIFTMSIETADAITEDIDSAKTLHSNRDCNKNEILNWFRNSESGVLVGVKMLDEGIDVPEADVAINAAAEKMKKQLIQRQGRILRRDGRYTPVFHQPVVGDEIEHYSQLGSVDPDIVPNPKPVIEKRLLTTVGTVNIWDIYCSLSSERLEQFHAADSLEAIEFSEYEWWLNIYRDQFPKLFEERIESDIS
jgi:superfamily II DNA or RNA helicase